MEFYEFQNLCCYRRFANAYRDDHTRMEPVCTRKDRIPDGKSWGRCDKAHCPHFGNRITGEDIIIYNSSSEKIGRGKSIKAMAVLEPEDYE